MKLISGTLQSPGPGKGVDRDRKRQIPAQIMGRTWKNHWVADVSGPEKARRRPSCSGSFQGRIFLLAG